MLSIKKIAAGILVAAIAVSLAACSKTSVKSITNAFKKPTTTQTQSTNNQNNNNGNQSYGGFTEQDARATLEMPCYVLEGLDNEDYNASYDCSVTYKGVWESWDDIGVYGPSYLVPEDEITDDTPTDSNCYFYVTNFSSNEQARDYLLDYMSQDVLNQLYGTPLFDYGDGTYLIRGGRGYAPMDRDYNNATITNLTDTSFTATMDCHMFSVDNYVGTCTIDMQCDGGSWYIVGYSQTF